MERTSAKTLQGDHYKVVIPAESRVLTSQGIVFVTTSKQPIVKAEVNSLRHLAVA